MADIDTLRTELTDDPLGRGYSGMTDQAAADSLNTKDRTRLKSSMSSNEIRENTDPTEWSNLEDGSANNTTDKKNHWLSFIAGAPIDPRNSNNVAILREIFGTNSTTEANLAAAREETVSRGEELGLGTVKVGWVEEARRG